MTDERVSDEKLREVVVNGYRIVRFIALHPTEAASMARELLTRRSGDAVREADARLAEKLIANTRFHSERGGSMLYVGVEDQDIAACRAAREGKEIKEHADDIRFAFASMRESATTPCDHGALTRYVGCGGRTYWICDSCEQVIRRGQIEPPTPPCCDPVHRAAVKLSDALLAVNSVKDARPMILPSRECCLLENYREAKAAAAPKVPDEAERIVDEWMHDQDAYLASAQTEALELRIRAAIAAAKGSVSQ